MRFYTKNVHGQPNQDVNLLLQRQMVQDRVLLNGVTPPTWTEDQLVVVDRFILEDHTLLVASLDYSNSLTVDLTIPYGPISQLTYFVKRADAGELNAQNFMKLVQYGTVMGGHIESLLQLMTGIYAPIFFENTSWPDNILNT